jgi:carbamoyl-phosphate synthase small subunit
MKKALLILQNNHSFMGHGIGQAGITWGECVFTTGMTGYAESLTDPSYAGQIICFSYPLIGNYGISPKWFESQKMFASGMIANYSSLNEYHKDSSWNLDEFLELQNKSSIVGIDTRKLVKILRNEGNQPCVLIVDTAEIVDQLYQTYLQSKDFNYFVQMCKNKEDATVKDWPSLVTNNEPKTYIWKNNLEETLFDPKLKTAVILDCGVKMNIIRELSKRIEQVVVVPANSKVEEILQFNPKGVLLSNGPGDPRDYGYIKETVLGLTKTKDLAIFGICLGHQLLSLAIGCSVYKMVFGNRGANQPVLDVNTGKAYLTSQNHGYATNPDSIPKSYKILFKNLNDQTVEGIEHNTKPIFSVQFHPEACGGPQDTAFLFDRFVKSIKLK